MRNLKALQALNDWLYVRELADGRLLGVMSMAYGKGRLWVGDEYTIDNSY
jgi:hypothetical protein